MARPVKEGLDYFPKDIGFYRDRKIRALIGRFGGDGAVLYDYILCEVYGDKGYYVELDESFTDIAAADLGMSSEKIGLILDYLLNKSMLFDGTLFKAVKVLTSHGIQARYQEASRERGKKRGIIVHGELWLLNEAETESFIQVRHQGCFSGNNCDKSRKNQSKSQEESTKERKGKESKGKERKNTPARRARGKYGWVKLTDEEYQLLEKQLGADELKRCIDYIDESAQLTQNKNRWKDWFVVIQRCHRDGWGTHSTGRSAGKQPQDYQPTLERVQKNDAWLDTFLAEQEGGGQP